MNEEEGYRYVIIILKETGRYEPCFLGNGNIVGNYREIKAQKELMDLFSNEYNYQVYRLVPVGEEE